ncbi:MAG: hypothetical protein Q9207_008067, partial [Kuettlingeria erythrocarpa]
HAPVIRAHDGHDIHLRLHRQMERPLLERAHLGPARITPRALGEDEDALPVPEHLLRGAGEGRARGDGVGAVDEHGAGEGHEPAEEGDPFQRRLGRDGAVGGEDVREQEDVEFGLVVPDYDAGARGGEVARARDDGEADVGGVGHDEGEGPGGEVLGEAVAVGEAQDEGNEDAVGGAEEEGEVGGEDAGGEGRAGDEGREGVEGEGEEDVGGKEVEGVEEESVHCEGCFFSRRSTV